MSPARPRVLANCAISLDGKLNPAPALRHGDFAMSRYPEDLRRMRVLRGRVDAVIAGASSLRADDCDLALADEDRASRRSRGAREPLRVALTRHGKGITPSLKIFDPSRGGETVVAHAASLPADVKKSLAPVATLVEVGDERVDVLKLLGWLATARGCATVLCEGGGDVNAAFFAARAIDELYLTICPRILGGTSAPSLVGGAGFPAEAIADGKLVELDRVGDELFLRYDFAFG